MPVEIISRQYTDAFGNITTFYKANAGDSFSATYRLLETIRVESNITNLLSYNPATKTITWGSGNFLQEGFRVGDDIAVEIYDASGVNTATSNVQINVVSANSLIHSGTITWYDASLGESVVIVVEYKGPGNLKRKGLVVDVNHVPNSVAGTEFSIIDGEVTRFKFDLTNTDTSPLVSGVQVGLKSGQFVTFANISDVTTYPNNVRSYDLKVDYVQSGIYDQNVFNFSDCLKLYVKTNWQRDYDDPNDMYPFVINDQADTGWYDEAFNTGVIDSVLVQGISEIDYSATNTGQISIDTTASNFYFGAAYVPIDDAYYKNQPYNQSELSMCAPSQGGAAPIVINGAFPNPDGANYTLTFSNPVTIGSVTTWDYEFIPNGDFITFMDGRSDGDRLFYIWAKAGNVNLLLFSNQLTTAEKQGDPINMIVHDFVDHSENITDTLVTESGFTGNVEDDIAFIGKFLLPINSTLGYVNCEIEALNSVTGDSFTLWNANFDLSSVPQVFGYYPVNLSTPVISTLPITSVKRNALLIRDSSIDTFTDYGIRVHFPFFYRWEYWLDQANANAEFYPNDQTKDWVAYGNTTNWNLNLKISAQIDGLVSTFNDTITIKDYDSDANVEQNIEIYVESTGQNVGVVVEGEIMRIVATHTLLDGTYWNPFDVWGMITTEPTESSPRWICSTIVPFDNNVSNPLTPITGLLCSLTFPTPDVAQMECFFDSSKINLENGVKFTTKIKGCVIDPSVVKLKTDGTIKYTTDGQPKLISF